PAGPKLQIVEVNTIRIGRGEPIHDLKTVSVETQLQQGIPIIISAQVGVETAVGGIDENVPVCVNGGRGSALPEGASAAVVRRAVRCIYGLELRGRIENGLNLQSGGIKSHPTAIVE